MPAVNYGADLWRYETPEIDAKAGVTTLIVTTNAELRFYPIMVLVEIMAANSLSASPSVTVGTNGSSYDNILGSTSPGMTPNAAVAGPPLASGVSIAPGSDIKVKVTVPASGTSGTFVVAILGFYK
jgi:hypothetical protein